MFRFHGFIWEEMLTLSAGLFKESAVWLEMMDGFRSAGGKQRGEGGREKVLSERWVSTGVHEYDPRGGSGTS